MFGSVSLTPVTAALPRRLGRFPFWRGEQPFLETVEPAYAQSLPRALDVFAGIQRRD